MSSHPPHRELLSKLAIFLLPLLVLACCEVAVLPIDFYNFRCWEALTTATPLRVLLVGPFYPNRHLERNEQGDLGHGTHWGRERRVEWKTDDYGFRTSSSRNAANVVVLGDSIVAGTGLTQRDTICEALARRTGSTVYPYAPSNINKYLADFKYRKSPPRVLVFMPLERSLGEITSLWSDRSHVMFGLVRFPSTEVGAIRDGIVMLDRLLRFSTIHYARSRLLSTSVQPVLSSEGELLFRDGDAANRDHESSETRRVVGILRQFDARLRSLGTRLVFAPVPNKETVYFDRLPSRQRAHWISDILEELRKDGIVVVNLQNEYERFRQTDSEMLYQVDDTHWSARAVNVAADALAPHLSDLPIQFEPSR